MSSRRKLDGPWTTDGWREYFPRGRNGWIKLVAVYAAAAALFVACLWFFFTR